VEPRLHPGTHLVEAGWHNFMVASDPDDRLDAGYDDPDLSVQKRFRIQEWGGLTIAWMASNPQRERGEPGRLRPSDYGRSARSSRRRSSGSCEARLLVFSDRAIL